MPQGSSFVLRVGVPQRPRLGGVAVSREEFFAWAWRELAECGLQGVHEGTALSEEAAREGFETDSWTVDAGEAPRERDWVGSRGVVASELYFGDHAGAERALALLREHAPGLENSGVEERAHEDWDASWKASFRGVDVAPDWRVAPPWEAAAATGRRLLRINPGAGFGTGTHETTQLCLGELSRLGGLDGARLRGARVLDFGSGSGILAIGAALLGARVDAVEIDELAVDNARENSALNGVESQITFARELPSKLPSTYPCVVANILRPVLLEFSERLCAACAPGGSVILSGLIEPDVESVRARYGGLLGDTGRVAELGEWRALVFRKASR